MVITSAQCRGARGMLSWSQADLHKASKVAIKTIADFEKGLRNPFERTLRDLRIAFEEAGIEFIDENGGGAGVRFKRPKGL